MGNCFSVQLSCDQVLGQACGCFFGDGNYISMMETNLETLENTMQQLRERRNDLSRRVSSEENKGLQRLDEVQGWISKVQDIESQVSKLLEAKSTETQRLCLFGYCSKKCKSSFEYGKKVSKKLKEVQELLCRGAFEVLAEKALVLKVEKQPIKTTIGLDSMVEKAWNILMDPKGTTLGLHGMGGVGKTTLLARINNKFIEVVNGSDVVIWVVVSKDLQIEGIQNKIMGRLRHDKEWKNETEEEKASSIYNILSRKKYVLLLDDIWSEVDLNKIGVPPPTPDNGSKIVFTTRSEQVCKDMEADHKLKVDCLSSDEAWELFGNIVGENILKCLEEIHTLARKVVEKCCGLPLALTVIGKTMKGEENVHEWRHTLNLLNSSTKKYPGMEEKILPILKVSYDGLKDKDFKSCFLYCSLFPEDYEIRKEVLIDYWICEGFINGNREEDGSSSEGHVIINSLVRAHLLMETETMNDLKEKVKMHDVIREMALWIASDSVQSDEELNFVKSGGQLKNIQDNIEWEAVKRISLMKNQIEEISCCPNFPKLLTLLLRDNSLEDISGEFFQFMPALVVLDLSLNLRLEIFPEEISSLSSLKYLNLSYTLIESLPVGSKGLNKLISLDLEFCFNLRSIDGIGKNLPNLQVLKLIGSGVWIDARVMEELQLLEHLEVLTGKIKDALILERIQGVKRLANCIRSLNIEKMSAAVVVLNISALSGLQRFDIVRCEISEIKIDGERSKEREELLCTNSPGFKYLSTVFISILEGPKELTWLLFAQNLRVLSVTYSGSIEEIINREKEMRIRNMHPYIGVPFSKLQSLELSKMSELKRISSIPLTMPNLREKNVYNCPNLPEAAIEFQRQEEE